MAFFGLISSIATGVGAWFSGLGVFGQGLVKIGLGLAANKIARALSGRRSPTAQFSVSGSLQRGADIPQSFIVGRYPTAGSLCWAEEWGTSGGTPNAYFTQVIELSNLPVRDLHEVWINGEKVTIDKTNPHSDLGWRLTEVTDSSEATPKNYDGFAWVKFYDGTQTTADSWLSTNFTTGDYALDSNFIGEGNAYVIVTTRIKQEGLWSGGWPKFLFVVDGIELLDPLTGVTGTDHDNPVHLIYTLARGLEYGSEWFYGAQKIVAVQLPAQAWSDQATKCVNAGFKLGAEIRVDTDAIDVIAEALSSCNGRMAESGGFLRILAVEPDAPVFSITDDDLLTTDEASFTPFIGLSDAVNGISVVHPSPDEGWGNITAPPLYRTDLEAEDDNRRLVTDVELPFVADDEQVQRLMKTALEEARKARKHTMSLGPEGWLLEPLDTIQWTSTENQYTAERFTLDGLIDKVDGDVILDTTQTDTGSYAWNSGSDFTPITHPSPVFTSVAPQQMAGMIVTPTDVFDETGKVAASGVTVAWQTGLDDVFGVRIQLREPGGSVFYNKVSDYSGGSDLITENLASRTDYEVRARFEPFTDRPTEWAAWVGFRTRYYSADAAEIAEDALENLAEKSTLLALREFDQDLKNRAKIRTSEIDIRVNATAITQEQELRESEDEALAALITTLTASVNTNAAAILTEQTARVTADDALAADITTLTATVGTNTAAIAAETTARTDGDNALSASLAALTATVGTNTADIATETSARAAADTALATDITNLTATVATNTADIATETTARTTADAALATDITNLTATVGTNTAAIATETTARVDGDAALTTSINTLTTSYNGTAAEVTTLQAAVTDLEGNASASYVMRVKAGTGGAELELVVADDPSGNPQSTARISADNIILDGSVIADHIAASAITAAKIAADSITTDKIAPGAVGFTEVSGTWQTTNFVSGSAGMQINWSNGNVEFNNLVVRGDMIETNAISTKTTSTPSAGSVPGTSSTASISGHSATDFVIIGVSFTHRYADTTIQVKVGSESWQDLKTFDLNSNSATRYHSFIHSGSSNTVQVRLSHVGSHASKSASNFRVTSQIIEE